MTNRVYIEWGIDLVIEYSSIKYIEYIWSCLYLDPVWSVWILMSNTLSDKVFTWFNRFHVHVVLVRHAHRHHLSPLLPLRMPSILVIWKDPALKVYHQCHLRKGGCWCQEQNLENWSQELERMKLPKLTVKLSGQVSCACSQRWSVMWKWCLIFTRTCLGICK